MGFIASSFVVAALMYPVDLVRALQMANAGSSLTTGQLLSNFKAAHGLKGFFTQGLAPELFRSTWMRFVKFGLFPVAHLAITNGIPEAKGTQGRGRVMQCAVLVMGHGTSNIRAFH
jgi:Mitochondrial carrier protein